MNIFPPHCGNVLIALFTVSAASFEEKSIMFVLLLVTCVTFPSVEIMQEFSPLADEISVLAVCGMLASENRFEASVKSRRTVTRKELCCLFFCSFFNKSHLGSISIVNCPVL